MRLAIALEGYTYSCWKLIVENQNAETPQDYEFPDWDPDLPMMPQYPDDPDGWRALDIDLANQVLSLPNQIEGGQAAIYAAIEFEEGHVQDVVEEQASKLGVDAWNLAGQLRHLYGLSGNVLAHGDAARALVTYREHAVAARRNKQGPIPPP
jgi:hypothetical protein